MEYLGRDELEDDIEALLLLKGPVTKELLEGMLEGIHRQYPTIKSKLSIKDLAEYSYNYRKYYERFHPEPFSTLILDDEIVIRPTNMEPWAGETYPPPVSFKNLVRVQICLRYGSEPYLYLDERPEQVYPLVDILCTICEELETYLALVSMSQHFHPRDFNVRTDPRTKPNVVVDYYEYILSKKDAVWNMFFLDDALVESVGMEVISRWTGFRREVSNVGILIARGENPFMKYRELDRAVAMQKDELFVNRIRPRIIERIQSETERVEGKLA